MPRVSIITPCYNASRFVGEMIESVKAQTYDSWELIIVNDGSTDNSVDVIQRYAAEDRRIDWFSQPNKGVGTARNAGFAHSSPQSEYVLFLDADDRLRPPMLNELVCYLNATPATGFVTARSELIAEDGHRLGEKWSLPHWAPTRFGLEKLPNVSGALPPFAVFAGSLLPSAILMRRQAFEETEGFDPNLHPCEDNDLFAQIAIRYEAHVLEKVLVYYRIHPSQSTSSTDKLWQQKKALAAKWETPLPWLTKEEQILRRDIWRAWHRNYIPHFWRKHALDEWRGGNLTRSGLLFLASILRWVMFSTNSGKDILKIFKRLTKR